MSDILTRLAARIRGEASVVSPRLPGLYAPAVATGPIESMTATAQPRNESDAEQAIEVEFPRPPVEDDHSRNQPSHSSGATHSETPAAAGADESPVQLIDPKDKLDSVPGSAPPLMSNEAVVPVTVESEPSRGDSDLPQLSRDHPSEATININPPPESASPLQGSTAQNIPSTSQLLVPNHPAHQVADKLGLPDMTAITEQSSQSQDTVHINIGSVEVTAHTPSPPSALPPARSKPVRGLSLTDYLKRTGEQL
jgi:hypothetical protein